MLCERRRTIDEWHRAFGHVNNKTLLDMSKNAAISGFSIKDQAETESDNACEMCPAAKMKHSRHPEHARENLKVGGRLEMDLIGKFSVKTLMNGSLLETNVATFALLNFSKEVTADKIQKIIGEFGPLTGNTVREIHCDNGSEFKNVEI